ncbi:MAG: glycosyltransferase [Candidatus Kaiserbacteria bacterium]|nr:glycosyltransferase [Candidatus Kaiserbacteria bacterium]
MRIAFFSDNFYPELSGISDSITATGKELAARGHTLHFYVPSHPSKDFRSLGLSDEEINLGPNIKIMRLWSMAYRTGSGQGRALILTGLRWLTVKKFNPDIIHVHLPFGAGIEGLLSAKVLQKPFVGTNHTPMTEFVRYSPIKFSRLNTWILKYTVWFYNRCCFISSPAQAVVDEMSANGFKRPYRIVSNPIDTKTFHPCTEEEKRALKNKFGFSDHTILYSGRLAIEKRADLVIRAMAKLIKDIPDLMYVIIGHGPDEARLKKLAADLGIAKQVKILGFIKERQELAEIYNASDVFAILSTAESQSIVAMQAMACGLPVVASKTWGLGEYVTPATGVLIDRDDEKSLPERLGDLLKDPQRMRELGRNGRAYVQKFSPENIAAEWEKIYEDVIKNRGAAIDT